jgi:molecular chaperone DnaK
MAAIFGLDFGTTNSLVTVIQDGRALALTDRATNKPHPSVVWYRDPEIVVGAAARMHMDGVDSGAADGFLRSPKMNLRRGSPLHVQGRTVDPVDAAAEVLRHLRKDAGQALGGAQPYQLNRAVMTVPVDFEGAQRRALRAAAQKAGISVVQFVHEPAAALYAYLRSRPDFREELARLENRYVIVFDWGGGTLDLTLCRISGGTLIQIASAGDNTIGGDEFDERLRNFVKTKIARERGIEDLARDERPGMGAKLLFQCEQAKIALSSAATDQHSIIVRDYLRAAGPAANLLATISRVELEEVGRTLVRRGLSMIDEILDKARLDFASIDCCLPTGGMVNMPAIRQGLVERFGGRVPLLSNGDRIISEGAAWIAHDDTRLALSKPIEVRVADGSLPGHFHVLVPASMRLPMENETVSVANEQFVCTDPRNGVAVFEFAKPSGDHLPVADKERETLGEIILPVDPEARPLLERLSCHLSIDSDYIAHVELKSVLRGATVSSEFHRLDFGLSLPYRMTEPPHSDPDGKAPRKPESIGSATIRRGAVGVAFRVNVAPAAQSDNRRVVAGDLAYTLWPGMFDARVQDASDGQRLEQMYYRSCSLCGRSSYNINANGRIDACPEACRLPAPAVAAPTSEVATEL